METDTSKFPLQNEIFKSAFRENRNYRGDMYKECNAKSGIEKCSFFNFKAGTGLSEKNYVYASCLRESGYGGYALALLPHCTQTLAE